MHFNPYSFVFCIISNAPNLMQHNLLVRDRTVLLDIHNADIRENNLRFDFLIFLCLFEHQLVEEQNSLMFKDLQLVALKYVHTDCCFECICNQHSVLSKLANRTTTSIHNMLLVLSCVLQALKRSIKDHFVG